MAGSAAKILVADDEPGVRELVGLHLRRDGHAVVPAADGREALRLFRRTRPDLVVLDLTLPGPGGLEVCRRMRSERRVPLIVLTARGREEDGIAGLDLGADDYVVKPFSPRELAARVQAVLRRANAFSAGPARGAARGGTLDFGGLRLEPDARKVTARGGAPVTLTEREFDLLYHLASHPKRVHTRAQLMGAVWGHAFPADTRTVTVHVRRLREKIEPDPARPRYIHTVWGVGYRFGGG
jgi:two-component system response regulator ResD